MSPIEIILLLIVFGFCYAVARYWHSLGDKPGTTPSPEPIIDVKPIPPPLPISPDTNEKLEAILQQVVSSGRLNKEQSELIGTLNTQIKNLKGQLENKLQETTGGIDDKKREQHLNTIFDASKKASWEIGEQIPETAQTLWRRSPEAELAESYSKVIMHYGKPMEQSDDLLFSNKMAAKNAGKDDELFLVCFPNDPVVDNLAFISVNYDTSIYNNLKTFRLEIYDLLKEYIECKACTIIVKESCKLEPVNERKISLMWLELGLIQKINADTWKIIKPIKISCY